MKQKYGALDQPSEIEFFDQLLDSTYVAQQVVEGIYDRSASSIWRMIKTGELPKPHKIRGSNRWSVAELRARGVALCANYQPQSISE